MSQDAYVGLPGAGKSHGVVEFTILPALRQGRRVVHNLPLNEDAIREVVDGGELVPIPQFDETYVKTAMLQESWSPARIKEYNSWTPGIRQAHWFIAWFRAQHAGALLVLDECWRYWASGVKASGIPDDQREFFAMHRHMVGQTSDGRTTDIVLVCQNLAQVAQFVRDLVEQTFHYQKQTVIGQANRYRCDVYQGPVTGPKPPVARRIRSFQGKYKPEVYKCYQTHTLSKGGVVGVEEKPDKRGNILNGWRVKIAVACACLAPLALWLGLHSFYKIGKPKEAAGASVASDKATAGAPGAATVPVKPSGPVESKRWRLGGLISVASHSFVVIESEGGPRRLPASACRRSEGGDMVCVLDGEIISDWTGKPERDAVQAFVSAAATPASAEVPR